MADEALLTERVKAEGRHLDPRYANIYYQLKKSLGQDSIKVIQCRIKFLEKLFAAPAPAAVHLVLCRLRPLWRWPPLQLHQKLRL